MIVVRITSLLANQMFAYAAVKSIAKDKGYDFKYIHKRCRVSEGSNSSVDKKYGRDFDTIFSIPESEKLDEFDKKGFIEHEELRFIKKYNSFYYREAMEISDNTYMKGHFICPKYFIHRIDEVREWFAFPQEVDKDSINRIDEIRKRNPGKTIVCVHFRVGQDYLLHGFLIDASYWMKAAEQMISRFKDVKFIVFCDKKTDCVKRFLDKYDCELMKGSLVEDMCLMTKCDAYILSNSTFSMMGALLSSSGTPYVIRPSHYFTGPRSEQKNCFLDDWDIVEARRNLKSFVLSMLKIGSIRNRIYDIFHKK